LYEKKPEKERDSLYAGWVESVDRLRRDGSYQLAGAPSRGGITPTLWWATTNLVYDRVPVRQPVRPVCLLRAESIYARWDRAEATVGMTMLLQKGFDVAMALQVYKNLRMAFPTLTSIRGATQLLNKPQLVAEFGSFYGPLISDVLAYPENNPLLRALLMGDVENPVPVQYGFGFIQAMLDKPALELSNMKGITLGYVTGIERGCEIHPAVTLDQAQPVRPLGTATDFDDPFQVYASRTGMTLPKAYSLNPMELDYEQIARQVRETHGPVEG
jgi:hypothetical protein